MNQNSLNQYKKLCGGIWCLKNVLLQNPVGQSLYAYTAYGYHLTKNFAPRFSTLQIHSRAYVPLYRQYNLYIIGALFALFLQQEFSAVRAIKESSRREALSAIE